jgi:UDP-GlcNAc:undecaprenyl-phosphate GlcNAc-1-phosphate transferase
MSLFVSFLFILLFYLIFFIKFEKFNNFLNTYDYPSNERKIHHKPISFTGGFLIIFSLNIYSITKIIAGDPVFFETEQENSLLLIIFLNLFFIIGILDDLKKISLKLRVILSCLLIGIFIFLFDLTINKLTFKYFEHEIFLPDYLNFFFTVICIFIFLNALNMYDGINGQSGTYLIFFFLIIYSISPSIDLIISIIFLIIFLYFNIKNKFFIGNSGINFMAILLSYLVIKLYKQNVNFNVEHILSLMFLPGIELIRLFFFRVINKNNPLQADNNHIHHILRKKLKLIYVLLINNFLAFAPYFIFLITEIQSLIFLNIILYFYIIYYSKNKS